MPPKGVVCYICGREFGYASFGIHEPQCMKVVFSFSFVIAIFYAYISHLINKEMGNGQHEAAS